MMRLLPLLLATGALAACTTLGLGGDGGGEAAPAAAPATPVALDTAPAPAPAELSAAAQTSHYVLPETETLRVARLEATALPDGRTVEQVDLGRGFMVIESLPGEAAFKPFPHDAFLPAADAVVARNSDGTLQRASDGYADGINWALYQGAVPCLFAQGSFGPDTPNGKQHAARLLLCGQPDGSSAPGDVKEEALAFLRGLAPR
ncbi:hypothetical protein [Caenispirillum bisanense]|uniref:Lipoprotein n=1 Tax=Caenispirillum bisanense TaxID=414052 RepID=A0A286GX39_9PROT|nr:hypothetical protein [Caenispirillum bisanense]SOE00061.1 hypothetical protein SAMN05421508_11162 [Caenispirillum bisanense]